MNIQKEPVADALDGIVQRLREHGYRVTPQRMAIVEALLSARTHPTAEEVHHLVAQRFPMVSLATVYKTLRVLQSLGLVRELHPSGQARFEVNPTPHAHLVCVRCGRVSDLPLSVDIRPPMDAAEAEGFEVWGYNLEVYGLCPACKGAGPVLK